MSIRTTKVAELSPAEKRDLLAALLRKKSDRRTECHPLSYGQNALWTLYQIAPLSPTYNLACTAELGAEFDEAKFYRAVQSLVARHLQLRATFHLRNGVPVQEIVERRTVEIESVDTTNDSPEALQSIVAEIADRPFDLERGPAFRVALLSKAEAGPSLVFVAHHIICDFWSMAILMYELGQLYTAEISGQPAALERITLSYASFVRRQQELLTGTEVNALRDYWQRQLAGAPATLNLPASKPPTVAAKSSHASLSFAIDTETTMRLRRLASDEKATLYMIVASAFATLLYRYTGQRDFVVLSPMLGRNQADFRSVVGYFSNPVPLRFAVQPNDSFRQFATQVRRTVVEAMEHQDFPFPLMAEYLGSPGISNHTSGFQAMLAWERLPRIDGWEALGSDSASAAVRLGASQLMLESATVEQRGAPFDLTLQFFDSEGPLRGCLKYNSDLFDESFIARFTSHLQVLLASIAANPDASLADVPFLTNAELQQQLVEWNSTFADYPRNVCLHELFELQAQKTPDATAIVFESREVTYRELNSRADCLAADLVALGVQGDTIVGVATDRSVEMIVALLGVLKAGGAYLPLNPSDPAERLATMLSDSQAPVVLTKASLVDRLPPTNARILAMDCSVNWSVEPQQFVRPRHTEANLAYVIYTSGSTGKPKGVMIEHRGICNRLLGMQDAFRLDNTDCVLHKTPLTFDVAGWEIFWPLIVGARLVIARPEGHRDPEYLVRLMAEAGVTTVHFVPSMLHVFVEHPGVNALSGLRRVICSGEALTPELVTRFYERSSAELHNLYGPTEASIDATAWHCPRQIALTCIPIGRPVANTQVYVLDEHLRPRPAGLQGELYLGGVQLARGYLNRPELTAERFLPNPFSSGSTERLYRTGDLARFLPDGNVEFLGRIDQQVKISGQRVELTEIEATLGLHPAVREAVVLARAGASGDKRLVAYVVPNQKEDATETVLREYLGTKLPAHMIPSFFVILNAFPLTSSGKIDRQALPAPPRTRKELAVPYTAPRTSTEQALAKILATSLEIDCVGIHDNFFALGGVSNQALDFIAKANAAGFAVNAEAVFRNPTLAELAAACEELQTPRGNTIVESLGVYLPPRIVSTEEIMQNCRNKLSFPLEELTGIRRRHVAGSDEFSIDLAHKAARECLARSRRRPEDIDLVICCNISRYDGPNYRFTCEPSTAIRLCARLGLVNAVAWDVSNACAGMFTGIALADTLLQRDQIRRALIVSGEYISHLIDTAQIQIESDFDPRMPCLTVGDAGAAVILERSADHCAGFHEIDLCTFSQYSSYCIAKATPQGATMLTDVLGVSSVVTQEGVAHWARTAQRHGWTLEDVQHLIPHQVSQTTVANGFNEARKLGGLQGRDHIVVCNVAERANTASTSHWVAVWDHVKNGRIKSGDNVIFGVSGSGITIGTALYTLDDLPERLLKETLNRETRPAEPIAPRLRRQRVAKPPRIAASAVATAWPESNCNAQAIALARRAAKSCFAKAQFNPKDLDLLIYTGVYRNELLFEPALATLLAAELGLSTASRPASEATADFGQHPLDDQSKPFFAFDMFNGGIAFMQACEMSCQRIHLDQNHNALVVAAEVNNNKVYAQEMPFPIQEMGSAILLQKTGDGQTGFGSFLFRNFPEQAMSRSAYLMKSGDRGWIQFDESPDLEAFYLAAIPGVVEEFLDLEGLSHKDITFVLPPPISSSFVNRLTERIGLTDSWMAYRTGAQGDLFSSALAAGLEQVMQERRPQPKDIGLLISVAAGGQLGCTVYYF